MKRIIISGLLLLCFAPGMKAQDDIPVTFSFNEVMVKTGESTYRYTDVKIIPAAGKETLVSPETISKYEPYAEMLRDSILFSDDSRRSEWNVIDMMREDSLQGRSPSGSFDITKVKWRNALKGFDVYGGVFTSIPISSGAKDKAFAGFTLDFAEYIQNAFIRTAIGGCRTDDPYFGTREFTDFGLTVSAGYMIPVGKHFAVSPFVGTGVHNWKDLQYEKPLSNFGYTVLYGIDLTFFRHNYFDFRSTGRHLTKDALRVRIYADQMVSHKTHRSTTSINASVCFGILSRNIRRQ